MKKIRVDSGRAGACRLRPGRAQQIQGLGQVARGLLPDPARARGVEERGHRRGRREVHRALLGEAGSQPRHAPERVPGRGGPQDRGRGPAVQDVALQAGRRLRPRPAPHRARDAEPRGAAAARTDTTRRRPSRRVASSRAPRARTGAAPMKAQMISLWTYDKDKLAPFGLSTLQARIIVDQRRGVDSLQNSGEVEKAIATAAQKSIVNPNATVTAASAAAATAAAATAASAPAGAGAAPAAPAGRAKPPAGAPAAPGGAAAAPAPRRRGRAARPRRRLPLRSPRCPRPRSPRSPRSTPRPRRTRPSGRAPSAPPRAIRSWRCSSTFRRTSPPSRRPRCTSAESSPTRPARRSAPTGRRRRSPRSPRGPARTASSTSRSCCRPESTRAPSGCSPSEGQPPVAASTVSFQLPEKSTEFEVSPLLLSNGIIPLTKRPGAADPFVFGSDKPMKVEPKGDRHFSKQRQPLVLLRGREPRPAGSDRRRRGGPSRGS